ncbi:phosphoribosylformimino-5-aminoimidazole carboxamide ribotide isomerase [Lachnospiraceae bacterium KM106-2]|nr:phosphoribosylformimino-5-aminoimidazole carboxamide ribotide isomerase [Lachnospiraceae bacterium KM106-2]
MRLFPVLDIKGGNCVRMQQGQVMDMEVLSHFPGRIARKFEEMGASYIHVVDVDGAILGRGVNDDCIREIVDSVSIPVQVGGGIRSIKDIENKLNLGVSRVIIGTLAVQNPAFVKDAITTFGADKIVVGIDAKNGMVAIEGWEKMSTYNAISLAKKMCEVGARTIVYTDILKGGMLAGPSTDYAKEIKRETGLEVIISGGVSSMKDLEIISGEDLNGVLIGKAIYDHKIDLKNAIELFEEGE